jgi:hypothetical protein
MESILRVEPLSKQEKEKIEKLLAELKIVVPASGHILFNCLNGKIANVEARLVWR